MAALAIMLLASLAAQANTLTAKGSDPQVMGWMQDFPPPLERTITQPDANYPSFPKLRWSVCHLHEFLPTEGISRGLGAPSNLNYASPADFTDLRQAIDAIEFVPLNATQPVSWEASLYTNFTDGMLILHEGEVVYELYYGCLKEDGKHAAMSMTKSVTGLLAETPVAEGQLDDSAKVIDIIPEINGSTFANATVRQFMDMTTGVRYSEHYSDPNTDIWVYSRVASSSPKAADFSGPDGYWEYLQQVKPDDKHGKEFHYKTINSDMLGWIVSRVTNKSVTDLTSERLWRPLGMEQDAYQTVDGKGVPFARGGLTAGLRDLGRQGLLMLNKGALEGKQVIPKAAVEHIQSGGRKNFGSNFPAMGEASYTSQWWVFHNEHGPYAARGVHGQTVYVGPTANMVLVRFASYPRAQYGFTDTRSLPAYQAAAEFLMTRSGQ
jgi:CubicO group peptidase (beta-lactamase class C family)